MFHPESSALKLLHFTGNSGLPVYSASFLSLRREHGWRRDGDWTPESHWMDPWQENVALTFTWQEWILLDISLKNLCRGDGKIQASFLISISLGKAASPPNQIPQKYQKWHKQDFHRALVKIEKWYWKRETTLKQDILEIAQSNIMKQPFKKILCAVEANIYPVLLLLIPLQRYQKS